MKLHRLRLENFKGVAACEVAFPDSGVILISGRNEIGKTSLIDAFDLLVGEKHGSKKRAVLAAQPTGHDVGVTVEADLTINDERFTLQRTWLRKPGTTLRFIEGRRKGHVLSGDQAHEAFRELWLSNDETLWKASRLLQATGLESLSLSGSVCLSDALQAAAGGEVIDSEGTKSLLTAVGDEAARYFTAGTRQPNAGYKQKIEAVKRAREARDQARTKLDRLESTRVQLDEITQLIGVRSAQVASAKDELADLERESQLIVAAQQAASEAERALQDAERELRAAELAFGARQELVAEVTEANDEVAAAQDELSGWQTDLGPLAERLADADAGLASARAQAKSATLTLDEARADCEHLGRVAERAQLQATLKSLDAAREDVAQLQQAASSPLSEALLKRLGDAEKALHSSEAKLEVGSAQLSVTRLDQAATLLVAGEAVADEQVHRAVTEAVTIEVPGTLRVEVVPPRVDELRAAASTARDQLAALLEQAAAASVDQARDRWVELGMLKTKLAETERVRDELLAGTSENALRDRLSGLERAIAEHVDAARDRELPTDAARADEAVAAAQTARDEASNALTQAEAARHTVAAEHTELANRCDGAISALTVRRRHLEQASARLDAQRAKASDESLQAAVEQANQGLGAARDRVVACAQRLVELDADRTLRELADARAAVDGLRGQLARREQERSTLQGVLQGMEAETIQRDFDLAETALEQATFEHDSLDARAQAAKRLEDALLSAQQQAEQNYIEPFRATIAELGQAMYHDSSFDVEVDAGLQVTGRFLGGEWIDFPALSTGAREQLVILIRLATAQLVNPTDRVPVILDDALGYSDLPRLRRMWAALAQTGEQAQVIVLTANEERYAGISGATHIDLGALAAAAQ